MKLDYKFIITMLFIHAIACLAFLPQYFSWSAVGVAGLFYWLTASVGICMGYHRYASHKSFSCPKWFEYFILTCGALACQGGPLSWVNNHRLHHKYSDKEKDPHNASKGFWWSHFGWLCYEREEKGDLVFDLYLSRYNNFLEKNFILLQILLGCALGMIGGTSWVIWGIFVRLVVVYHVTWMVNSVCHLWGYKNYNHRDFYFGKALSKEDQSKNNWLVSLLTFGEGNHNNHHRFPNSAKTSIIWREIDMSFWLINILHKIGIIKKITIKKITIKP